MKWDCVGDWGRVLKVFLWGGEKGGVSCWGFIGGEGVICCGFIEGVRCYRFIRGKIFCGFIKGISCCGFMGGYLYFTCEVGDFMCDGLCGGGK